MKRLATVSAPSPHLYVLSCGSRNLLGVLCADNVEQMNRFTDSVVTLVIEDRLDDPDNSKHKKMQQQLQALGLWDKVFRPTNEMNNDQSKWPTLASLRSQNKHLLCFKSKQNSNLSYQWDFMTETKYGNDSLKAPTWIEKRAESQKLGTLATFAMNHFPSIQANLDTGKWWSFMDLVNHEDSLKGHIDACVGSSAGIPNWLNVDYIEAGWYAKGVAYCNQKFKLAHAIRAMVAPAEGVIQPVGGINEPVMPKLELVEGRFLKKIEDFEIKSDEASEVAH